METRSRKSGADAAPSSSDSSDDSFSPSSNSDSSDSGRDSEEEAYSPPGRREKKASGSAVSSKKKASKRSRSGSSGRDSKEKRKTAAASEEEEASETEEDGSAGSSAVSSKKKASKRNRSGSSDAQAAAADSVSEEEEADDDDSAKASKTKKKGHKTNDVSRAKSGEFADLADRWFKMLSILTAARVKGESLLYGSLPEPQRAADPQRVQIDVLSNHLQISKDQRQQLKQLRNETETAFRAAIKNMSGKNAPKNLAAIKLLVSKRGARAQEVHFDAVEGARKCYSVLLHCNDAAESTCVPDNPADIAVLRALATETPTVQQLQRAVAIKKNLKASFKSHPVVAGDAVFFRADVPHYGPAVHSDRVLLYALFSPNTNPRQDHNQVHPLGDLKGHVSKIRKETARKLHDISTKETPNLKKRVLDAKVAWSAAKSEATEAEVTAALEAVKQAEEQKNQVSSTLRELSGVELQM